MYTKVLSSDKETFLFALEELKEKLERVDFDFLIFAISPIFNHAINETIQKIFKTNNYIAFHAIDSFCDNEVQNKSVVMLAINFEKSGKVSKFFVDDVNNENAIKTSDYLNNNQDKFHLIFANHSNGEINSFIEKISKNINYSPVDNIAGGVASGMEVENELILNIFTENKILNKGLIILSFENVDAEVGVSLGFKPYGITYKITKAQNNRIYSVDDGKNFAYMIKKLFKNIENPDIRYLWYTPIYILDKEDSYISATRVISNITDDYVEFFANVEEGKFFKIAFATYLELLKEDKKIAENIIQKLSFPEVCLNFSCIARQYVLEDKSTEENKIYTKTFNTHLFGFFTFGEIGPDIKRKKLVFYNETSLPVIMKEK
jgi:hypothetical protein